MKRYVVAVTLCLFLSGCRGLSDCGWEDRSVAARGVIIENGAELVSADVSVGATRGSLLSKSLDVTISGTSLKGHVTSINLVRSDDPAFAPVAIPIDSSFSSLISSASMIQRAGEVTPNLGGLFEIVAANLGLIEITTDLPSRPRVSIPLTMTYKTDWIRPGNCY